jgi:signal transduction histidine kinase
MLEPISEPATLALAPIAATVGLLGRARAGRRRERVNRALHEVRRPLAALALAMPAGSAPATDHLERAISALEQLDAELNGGRRTGGPCIVEPERIAADAVARWRPLAERARRTIELRWRANGSRVRCDPAAVDRALDNLIGNALEHGAGPISVEGAVRASRLRVFVVDGAGSAPPSAPAPPPVGQRRLPGSSRRWGRDPRRGHGLRLVAEFAAENGGRFAACRHGNGACAVIELPLAER